MASPPTGPTPATPLLPKSSAPAPPPPLSWREIIRVIGPLAVPAAGAQRRYAALALIITGAEAMVWVLPPLVLKAAVDVVTANVGRPPEEAASPYAPILLYFGLAVVSLSLGAMLQVTQRLVEVDVERRASVHFFRHLHSLSLGYHVEKRSGAVIKVMDRAVTAVVSLMNELCFTVLPLLLETCLGTWFLRCRRRAPARPRPSRAVCLTSRRLRSPPLQ
jgi:ATP-binding cassette, subfamily B, heavy metal transporter